MSEMLSNCSEVAARLIDYIIAYRLCLFGVEHEAAPQLSRSSARRGSRDVSANAKQKSMYLYRSMYEIFMDAKIESQSGMIRKSLNYGSI